MNRYSSAAAVGLLAGSFCLAGFAADSTDGPGTGKAPKSCQIRNEKYGNLLRPKDANSATGTPLVLYPAEPWKCMTWKFLPAGEGKFHLQNHFTSKTLASGEEPQGWVKQVPFEKDPAARPTWEFTRLPEGTYKIVEAKSGKALTAVPGATGGSTVSVAVQAWRGGEEQKWRLEEIDPRKLTM